MATAGLTCCARCANVLVVSWRLPRRTTVAYHDPAHRAQAA